MLQSPISALPEITVRRIERRTSIKVQITTLVRVAM